MDTDLRLAYDRQINHLTSEVIRLKEELAELRRSHAYNMRTVFLHIEDAEVTQMRRNLIEARQLIGFLLPLALEPHGDRAMCVHLRIEDAWQDASLEGLDIVRKARERL